MDRDKLGFALIQCYLACELPDGQLPVATVSVHRFC